MKVALLEKLAAAIAFPTERGSSDPARPAHERFPIPHSFKPQLSLHEAVLSAGGSFLRIFLGSILFAFWGAYTYLACVAVKNIFWRGVLLFALIGVFAVLLALLLMAITAAVRSLWPQRRQHP